jgi:predicted negative regulator of RcsB-dependent stress response
MAIDFDCPHCGTHYRLKDEVGGKTATCKNPSCRKVIPIPKAQSNGKPVAPGLPADLDAFAAAAFLDDPAQTKTAEETISVSCAGCDHTWQVEASKEGKNVLCPECRRPNRVPLRKKAEKADWRTGSGPTLAKRETGLDREGAFGTAHMGGISDTTAREIVKSREAVEEPEERRKKWIKRGLLVGLTAAVFGVGGYFVFKGRQEGQQEARMEEAVKELKEATKDPRYHALILRASAEHRVRASESKKETDDALNELKLARNILAQGSPGAKAGDVGPDRNAILAQVAITMGDLLGNPEQAETGERLKKDDLTKDLRITVGSITDADLAADVLRALTRKFAQIGQATAAEDAARQLGNPTEMVAQIGLELLRLQPEANRAHAEDLVKRAAGGDAPALQALRLALGHKQPAAPAKKGADAASALGTAEAEALRGNTSAAGQAAARAASAEERVRAYTAAAQAVIDSRPTDAGPLLDSAVTQAKGATLSLGLAVRLCRLLAKAGKFEAADAVVGGLPDDGSRGWARLEILRGRLAQAGNGKADDGWLTPLGDPTKSPAAAKGHEEVARHNAANGIDYQATVKSWPAGTVQPLGRAGLILGGRDRK